MTQRPIGRGPLPAKDVVNLGDPLPTKQCVTALKPTAVPEENLPDWAQHAPESAPNSVYNAGTDDTDVTDGTDGTGKRLTIDAAQAHWHLDLLGRDERDVHIRAIPHKGKRGFAINGNFAMDLERFQDLNNQGYGLYLQPNIGGTLKDEVTLCTSLFWEHDDRPRSEQVELWQSTVGLQPTFQIDTGGKSIHNYLVLDTPMAPGPWTLLMERLQLAAPGCDKSCKGNNRMMRMAGAHYIDREGKSRGRSQIINADGPRYSAEELDAVLPPLLVPSKPNRKKLRTGSASVRQIAEALDYIPRRVGGTGTYAMYRDVLWGLKAALADAGAAETLAIQLMEAHSPSSQCDWDVEQVARSGGEQIGAGTLFHYAKQHGWSRHAKR